MRLLSYVRPYLFPFLLAIFGLILYSIVDAGMIKFLQPLLNKGFVERDPVFISWIPIVVVGIFVGRGIATFFSTYFMGWVARNVVMNFRQQMFQHMLRLPTKYYDKTTTGEILSKITYNVEQVANASSDALAVLIREGCTVIGLLIVMISISWRILFLFIITAPIMIGIMYLVSKRVRFLSSRIQDSMGNVTHVAEEGIEGQKVIKAFGGQHYETTVFNKTTKHNRQQEMKLIVTEALSIPMVQLVGSLALAITIYLATVTPDHALGTAVSPGAFAAMMTAMISILKPIKQLTKVNSNIQRGIAGAASIFAFLDEKPEEDIGTKNTDSIEGKITFDKVSFSYHETTHDDMAKTLENISFEINAGETVAIVGRSGGGKSTLVNLLPRFYEAGGEIKIDGINIKEMPLKTLRHHIAIVTQQVTLFNDTIANNIAYGCENTNQDEVIAAAKSAYAYDFIQQLPQGFNTIIGENGLRLSGGQRQRIAIARAIFKRAPILILDEATSALDTESERYIQAALDDLMAHCTTLVIAHRLSTIEKASRIIVIDGGKIIEIGTHAELIAKSGVYASLRTLQYEPEPIKIAN